MEFKNWLQLINESESRAEKDDKAEKAAKKVAKDIEYDEGHKGKDDDKAERAGKKVKKDMEYDMKKKKSLKDWFDHIDANYLKEGTVAPGQKPLPVLDPQNKTTGAGFVTSNDPAVQNMIKNLDPKDVQIVQTTSSQTGNTANTGNTVTAKPGTSQMSEEQVDEKWAGDAKIEKTGQYAGKSAAELKSMLAKLKKSGPHHKDSKEAKRMRQINFALRAKGGWKKGEGAAMKEESKLDEKAVSQQQQKFMGMVHAIQKGEKIKGASKELKAAAKGMTKKAAHDYAATKHKGLPKKIKEADIPPQQGIDVDGAGLGAGRSKTTLEAKKTGKAMKKAKINESMHKHNAAKLLGKAHALAKEGYNCKFEDMEEARMYHEGYKEGLDECYGQLMPVAGLVKENPMPAATVPGMASQAMPATMEDDMAMEDDMDEGNAFTAALAKTPKGGHFSLGGKTFTDRSNYDSKMDETDMSVFESWDKELNNLLTEYNSINSPVVEAEEETVEEAVEDTDEAAILIKHAGLGKDHGHEGHHMGHDIGDLLAKLSHVENHGQDYEQETSGQDVEENLMGHMNTEESMCNECGMMESGCGCEKMDEMQTQDQKLYTVAEDNPPDDGSHNAMNATLGNAAQNMVASKTGGATHEDLEEGKKCPACGKSPCECDDEEETDESKKLDEWANQAGSGPGKGTDAQFTQDIEFMTKVISGGLNKPKRDQTTLPHTSTKPSLADDSMLHILKRFDATSK